VIVMATQQQYSRQHAVDLLNRLGFRELADKASRDLPDPVDAQQLEAWGVQHGLDYDVLIGRMSGSP
jgi:hypothetical protein